MMMSIRRLSVAMTVVLLVGGTAFGGLGQGDDLEIGNGSGTGNGAFSCIRDMAFDAEDNLYVLDWGLRINDGKTTKIGGNGLIQKFDKAGKFVSQFAIANDKAGDKSDPTHLALDSKGSIYITQPKAGLVQQFSNDGKLLKSIDLPGATAITAWTRDGKECLAVITSVQINQKPGWKGGDAVYALDLEGNLTEAFKIDSPMVPVVDMCSDGKGNIYVLGPINQVCKFGPDGKLLTTIGSRTNTRAADGSELLHSIRVDSKGNIYSWAFGNPGVVTRFDADVTTVWQREGQFKWADAWSVHSGFAPLAVDGHDRLWVGVNSFTGPSDPNWKSYHPRPCVLRVQADWLDKSVPRSALALGLKCEYEVKQPYGIAYELAAQPLVFVVRPGNRRIREINVSYTISDMYKREAAKGTFTLALEDGKETRQEINFVPPKWGWYTITCDISSGGKLLSSLGRHLGYTPEYPGLPTLTDKAEHGRNAADDPTNDAFCGIMFCRSSPGNAGAVVEGKPGSLDALEKDVVLAQKHGVTLVVQFAGSPKDFSLDLVRKVVEQFKGRIRFYECINEPDLTVGTGEKYVETIKPAVELIKQIDPQAQVLGPSTCGIKLDWIEGFLKAGGGKLVDALSVHDYEGHESIDPTHWQWKYGQLRQLMAKYDAGDKPIFQTERAISGVRGGNFMGPSQAVRMLLHRDLLESAGIPTEHNAHFYVNEHGFGQCPSYIMGAAGPHPAALAMRTRRAETAGLKFSGTVDFGPTGNKVFMALRYDGPERSVITLRNYGTTDQQLEAAVTGGEALEVVDAFGNVSKLPVQAGKANLTVGQMPIFLRLAKGQQVTLPKWDFGPNIAPAASFAYSGTYQGKFDCLTNGVMEGYNAGNPVSNVDHAPIFWGEFKQAPQTLEIKFPQPRTVNKLLVFGVRADNQYCALLDYDLQCRKGDSWVTIQEARAHCPPSNWSSVPLCIANTWYLDNNFFVHQFEPVTTDSLRLVIKRVSFGFAPDEIAHEAVFRTWGGRREPFVMIREIEIYGPPGASSDPSSQPPGQAATGPAGKAEPPPKEQSASRAAGGKSLQPVVEVEEELYTYKPADNGAGPMWCYGNTCIVRVGDKVFASGIRTLADYIPLNNVRWMLYQNAAGKWTEAADGGDSHEREPCPIVCFDDGRVFLSTNPNSCKSDQKDGPADPTVLQFDAADPSAKPKALMPKWNKDLAFHGHTYRSFAADGKNREMVLFYSTAYDKTYWNFCDSKGQWSSQGEVDFPWGKEYDKPQPVRICYPTVQIKDRAVYCCGVSDITEPYEAWRDFKKKLTGQEWDYDFRRLFFTWSEDITKGKFHPWVEIASRDKTAGWLFPCDLWVGPDKRVHILWSERALDTRLREKFFPDAKQSVALNYAVVQDGKVVLRKAIQQWDEGKKGEQPGRGRFHVTPDGRLLVLYFVSGTSAAGQRVSENRLIEIDGDGTPGNPVKVPLKVPMDSFFTAGVRGGSAPSMAIDLLGESGKTLRYCRVRLR